VNRRDRRRKRRPCPPHRRPSETVRAVAALYRCPDCMSTVDEPVLADGTSRVWRLNVRHDDTCPTYRRLKSLGLAS
jgi:hypothetical protein